MIGRAEKVFLGLATALTGATGAVYAAMKYLLTNDDPYSVVNHPWQPAFLSGHVLAAPLLLFAFGLVARHVVEGYRNNRLRRARRTGLFIAALLAPMVASGYLLQVLTSAPARELIALLHLAAGLTFLAGFGAHLRLGGRPPSAGLRLVADAEREGQAPRSAVGNSRSGG